MGYFNVHTVKLEASIAFLWNHFLSHTVRADVWFRFLWLTMKQTSASQLSFHPKCSREMILSFKPSIARWIGSMCLWPFCFMVTLQGFWARETRCKMPLLFCVYTVWGHRAKSQGAAGAVNSGPLLRANPLTENKRCYTWTPEWSSLHRSICINTVRVLMHANICTGVWNCQFLSLIVLCYALARRSLLVSECRWWMRMHAWRSSRVDTRAGKGPHQPGHGSSVERRVAMDCC